MADLDKLEALRSKYSLAMVPCEICGGSDWLPLQKFGRVAEPGVYGPLQISICRVCGFKMLNPRYEAQYYQDYYQELYRTVAFGQARPTQEYLNQQKERGRRVLEYLSPHISASGKMLDHGCASGATMLAWREAGWSTIGIDPHKPSVEAGRNLFDLNIEIASGEALPIDDASVDLIVSLGSLEHVVDLGTSMKECRRVLKNEGSLLIRWRSSDIFGSPLEYYNHNHYRFFSRQTWRLLLLRYGFSITEMTSERVEGWDSYEYILARKAESQGGLKNVLKSIAEGGGDDAQAEISHLKEIRSDYLSRCVQFLELNRGCSEGPDQVVRVVKAKALRWGFLGGSTANAVTRAQMEAERYLSEHAAGRVK
jgi:ubiquinone/menaquinone biosynthesis C-methylase UbiE